MNKDYDDVGNLLSQMHLQEFSYRTFKHGEAAPATAKPAEPAPAPPLRVVRSSEAPRPAPARKPDLQSATPAAPAQAVPQTPPEPAATGRGASLSGTFDRLARGSIADSTAPLDLHLELPERPLGEAGAAGPAPERTLAELFQQLGATAQPGRGRSGSGHGR
jgi:hypothetical protein